MTVENENQNRIRRLVSLVMVEGVEGMNVNEKADDITRHRSEITTKTKLPRLLLLPQPTMRSAKHALFNDNYKAME